MGVNQVRVRFAPSPTGPLHIGGLRTALFNYLFAKHHHGNFILRIEDTDQTRSIKNAENYIVESLKWFNIIPDESPQHKGEYGPYRQSERKAVYAKYINQLIKTNKAYYAFDTLEELENYRKLQEKKGKSFSYNACVRTKLKNSLNPNFNDTSKLIKQNYPYVIRFNVSKDTTIETTDLIKGKIKVNSNILDDKVLMKSDFFPTYHLANVVDDYLMKITHVIRGEEWLPSLPLHHLLYKAFGWENSMPYFAHIPLILKPIGKGKLSKRDAEKGGFPIFPINWEDGKSSNKISGFRECGYYPEALLNTLALLGWNPTTPQEIFSLTELINIFHLKNINQAGASFNIDKAKWFNHHYLQKKPIGALAEELLIYLKKRDVFCEVSYAKKVCSLMKERVSFVSEIYTKAPYFFNSPIYIFNQSTKKSVNATSAKILLKLATLFKNIKEFDAMNIERRVKEFIQKNNYPFGMVLKPLRLAMVGKLEGPPIFEIISIIGKEESLKRISRFLNFIQNNEL